MWHLHAIASSFPSHIVDVIADSPVCEIATGARTRSASEWRCYKQKERDRSAVSQTSEQQLQTTHLLQQPIT